MKKIFTTIVAGLMISAQVLAVSVKDVCGQFDGDLWIDWDEYPNRSVYLLPGAVENTLTTPYSVMGFANSIWRMAPMIALPISVVRWRTSSHVCS